VQGLFVFILFNDSFSTSTVLTKILLDVDGVLVLLLVLVVMMKMIIIIIVITAGTTVESIRRISAWSMQVSLLTKFHIVLHYCVFIKLEALVLFCT